MSVWGKCEKGQAILLTKSLRWQGRRSPVPPLGVLTHDTEGTGYSDDQIVVDDKVGCEQVLH